MAVGISSGDPLTLVVQWSRQSGVDALQENVRQLQNDDDDGNTDVYDDCLRPRPSIRPSVSEKSAGRRRQWPDGKCSEQARGTGGIAREGEAPG